MCAEPAMRSWTSTAGSTVEATLVQYDDSTITLRFENGAEKAIPANQLSMDDQIYVREFPALKKEAPPWVSLEAKTGSIARNGNTSSGSQRKTLDITVTNHEQRAVPIKLFWLMLGNDFVTKGRTVIDVGIWMSNLQPRESRKFRTPESTTSFSTEKNAYLKGHPGFIFYYNGGYYKLEYQPPEGAEMKTFIVQALWNDNVVDAVSGAASPTLREAIKNPDLVKAIEEAGYVFDSSLKREIEKALKASVPGTMEPGE